MYCSGCGNQLLPEAEFCPKCGTSKNKVKEVSKKSNGMGYAIASLFAWILPLAGYPVSIIGIVKASKALQEGDPKAKTALALSIVGLVLTTINSAIGAYMGATGQL